MRRRTIRRRRAALLIVVIAAAAAIGATAMWPGSHSLASSTPTRSTSPTPLQTALPAEASPPAAPTNQAKAACVIDRTTGMILYAKSADAHLPMGSTTKIMTALLVLEHVSNLDV